MKLFDAFLNATAVWFALKAVEVIPLAFYDIIIAAKKRIRFNPFPDTIEKQDDFISYHSSRGKLEYILSGAGFADLTLWRKSKKWMIISTVVPLLVFVLELMSIFLSNETRRCETSRDPNVVSAPGLELFGNGERETDVRAFFTDLVNTGSLPRPCVNRHSRHSGVDFESSICGETHNIGGYEDSVKRLFPSNRWIGFLMLKRNTDNYYFHVFVFSMSSRTSLFNSTLIGSVLLHSETLVNGRNALVHNVTTAGIISEEDRYQVRADTWLLEESAGFPRSTYHEDYFFFGFVYAAKDSFAAAAAAVYAVLSQTTRARIKPAAEMSVLNTVEGSDRTFDVTCQDDHVLPRTASLVVVLVAILVRSLLICLPRTVPSVEFSLVTSEEIANTQESSIFFMDRKPSVCRLTYSNNGLSNHVGYTSLARMGTGPNLPWK